MRNRIIFGACHDPWHNLALEALLFDRQAGREGVTFYIWQNENTVVIGKNQNAWQECRNTLLEQEGGKLARRTSGGGAVFHDLGNLNFTFLTSRSAYDVKRQLSVIVDAVAHFGIKAEFSGRNDLLVGDAGAKFSGNAFRFSNAVSLHHGTVLISADMDKLGRYLAPSADKLNAKGIKSVRARVANLVEFNKEITVAAMSKALASAFVAAYGPADLVEESRFAGAELDEGRAKHAAWEWRLGKTPRFDVALEERFDWGGVTLHLDLGGGYVEKARVYSDAMDEAFIEALVPALTGCRFASQDIAMRLAALARPEAVQLADWILEKGF